MPKTHLRHMRLYNNAGMNFPSCYANAPLLDTDKGRLPISSDHNTVSCKHCQKIIKNLSW